MLKLQIRPIQTWSQSTFFGTCLAMYVPISCMIETRLDPVTYSFPNNPYNSGEVDCTTLGFGVDLIDLREAPFCLPRVSSGLPCDMLLINETQKCFSGIFWEILPSPLNEFQKQLSLSLGCEQGDVVVAAAGSHPMTKKKAALKVRLTLDSRTELWKEPRPYNLSLFTLASTNPTLPLDFLLSKQ